ncbi:helix-turn-helix transcriptional regulator [Streptomyces sp. NPDC001523]|uniref:helix-turn-helix domain-containing protein n=1 Tax=Streptomyces sp. NPDC001523 TaxID=3154383 RepID=UPI00332E5014
MLTYGFGELRTAADTMRGLRGEVEERLGPLSDEALAKRLGISTGALRSYALGRTMIKPAVLRALAELAGVQVSRVYAEMGWLPRHEVSAVRQSDLPEQLRAATSAVTRLSESLDGLASQDTGRAALLAAGAVLNDEQAAARFQVRLSALRSGVRCPAPTTLVAEFTPGDDALPLTVDDLTARALAVGLRPVSEVSRGAGGADAASTRHRLFQAELEVVTAEALSRAGDCSWQGEPGTTLWRPVCRRWPTHLLVQHVLTGQPFADRLPWVSTDGLPVVVIGADYSIGPAAALLAKALGWRFVPVSSATAFDSGRLVRSQALSPATRRRQGWGAAARRAGVLTEPAAPWPVVMLVRPYVFGDQDAYDAATLRLLRNVRAHIVYARPSPEHLDWWARRRQLTARDAQPADAWTADILGALTRVEEVLEERSVALGSDHDLRLRLAPPSPAPDAADPLLPGALTDSHFDAAALCLRWLDQVVNRGRASLLRELRPSALRDHLPGTDTSGRTVAAW